MTKIAVIDCAIGNLRSVQKILERVGAEATIARAPEELYDTDAMVLPGVGAFRDAMAKLNESGLSEAIQEQVRLRGKPILGICLGMQLLARDSEEDGDHEGLSLVAGSVRRLDVAGKLDWAKRKLTLPHIGWNSVTPQGEPSLFKGIQPGADFYFVHGYHLVCDESSIVAASCEYGETFVSAVETDNIFAAQFHPEKSQSAGQRLLQNFVERVSAAV